MSKTMAPRVRFLIPLSNCFCITDLSLGDGVTDDTGSWQAPTFSVSNFPFLTLLPLFSPQNINLDQSLSTKSV